MTRWTRIVAATAVVAALGACGGGSGGDPGAGAGFQVTPAALTFTSVVGDTSAAPSQTVVGRNTTGSIRTCAGGWPPGAPAPTWVHFGTPSAGSAQCSLPIGVSLLAAKGTYTATIRMAIERTDGSVSYGDVAVTYEVRSLAATPASVASSWILGDSAPPASRSVSLRAATPGTAWTVTGTPPWLDPSPTASATPQTVTLSFDPTGLATGLHAGAVTFSGGGETAQVAASFTIAEPEITRNPPAVQLAGLGGHDLSPKRVSLALRTGRNAWPFTVETSDPWIELVQLATTLSSAERDAFTIAPTGPAKALPAGTSYTGSVTITVNVSGVPIRRVLPVTYRLDDEKLVVSDPGVAFTRTPAASLLTRALTVATNRGTAATPWTASSSAAWLDVTPGGTTPDPLVLTVDPVELAGLATDALYLATVTVATGALADGVDTVRVGLWVGSTAPEPVTSVAVSYERVAADPVRPWIYLHAGGSGVDVRNVLTGALVTTIPSVGTSLGAMAVSGDGARLFVVDETTRRVVPVRLETLTVDPSWAVSGTIPLELAWARPNKTPVLLTTQGTVHAPATGAVRASFPLPWIGGDFALGASGGGARFCVMERSTTTYTLECRGLDATTTPGLASPIVIGPAVSNGWQGGSGHAVALSPDGTRVYAAPGSAYTLGVADPTRPDAEGHMPLLQDLPLGFYPSAVTVAYDGRIFGASTSSVSAYDAAGNQTGTWSAGGELLGGPVVSGDGLRLVLLTRSSYSGPATRVLFLPAP